MQLPWRQAHDAIGQNQAFLYLQLLYYRWLTAYYLFDHGLRAEIARLRKRPPKPRLGFVMYPEKKILGVCAWLSVKFGVDVSTLRLLFVAAAILGLGSPILIYLILAVVKP